MYTWRIWHGTTIRRMKNRPHDLKNISKNSFQLRCQRRRGWCPFLRVPIWCVPGISWIPPVALTPLVILSNAIRTVNDCALKIGNHLGMIFGSSIGKHLEVEVIIKFELNTNSDAGRMNWTIYWKNGLTLDSWTYALSTAKPSSGAFLSWQTNWIAAVNNLHGNEEIHQKKEIYG